jgi:hypothetical protein
MWRDSGDFVRVLESFGNREKKKSPGPVLGASSCVIEKRVCRTPRILWYGKAAVAIWPTVGSHACSIDGWGCGWGWRV